MAALGRMRKRPRRNRKSEAVRGFHRETFLSPRHFVLPLFIHDGDGKIKIESMPGCYRLSLQDMMEEVQGAVEDGIVAVEVFPAIDDSLKTADGAESFNQRDLCQGQYDIKSTLGTFDRSGDVALDPYSSDGHDGIVKDGAILNDETVRVLCKQTLCARALVDIIAPSDMMDGRIGAIGIRWTKMGLSMSRCFRMLQSMHKVLLHFGRLLILPKFGDKKTYQMDWQTHAKRCEKPP